MKLRTGEGQIYRIISISLAILLAASLLLNYHYHQVHREEEWHNRQILEMYINSLHASIGGAAYSMERILDAKPEGERLHKHLANLSAHLERADYLLGEVAMLVQGADPVPGDLFLSASATIKYGTKYDGITIPPFGEDEIIDQRERAYLEALNIHLQELVQVIDSESGDKPQLRDLIPDAFDDHPALLEKYLDQ